MDVHTYNTEQLQPNLYQYNFEKKNKEMKEQEELTNIMFKENNNVFLQKVNYTPLKILYNFAIYIDNNYTLNETQRRRRDYLGKKIEQLIKITEELIQINPNTGEPNYIKDLQDDDETTTEDETTTKEKITDLQKLDEKNIYLQILEEQIEFLIDIEQIKRTEYTDLLNYIIKRKNDLFEEFLKLQKKEEARIQEEEEEARIQEEEVHTTPHPLSQEQEEEEARIQEEEEPRIQEEEEARIQEEEEARIQEEEVHTTPHPLSQEQEEAKLQEEELPISDETFNIFDYNTYSLNNKIIFFIIIFIIFSVIILTIYFTVIKNKIK